MYPFIRYICVSTLFAGVLTSGASMTATSPVLGGWRITTEGDGLSLLSLPLQIPASAVATVERVGDNGSTFWFSDPIDPNSEFAPQTGSDGEWLHYRYYCVEHDSPDIRYPVQASGEYFLSLAEVPTDVSAGSVIEVRPYRTLDEVFGSGNETTLASYASDGQGSIATHFLGDAVFLLRSENGQQTLLENARSFALIDGEWKEWERNGAVSAATLPGMPVDARADQALLLRRLGDVASTEYILLGEPPSNNDAPSLPTPAAGEVLEVPFVLIGAQKVFLNDVEALSGFTPSTSEADRVDELIVPEFGHGGVLRGETFYKTDSGWRRIGDPSADVGGTVELHPGRVYIIRRR